jgi:quinolinate synthase
MEVATLRNKIRKLLRERNAVLIVHYYERPEIQEIADILGDSLAMADFVGSTAGIIRFATTSTAREIILGTEDGVIVKLKRQSPDKTFIPASGNLICRTMKRATLEDIHDALREMKNVIRVPAKRALDRMLALS